MEKWGGGKREGEWKKEAIEYVSSPWDGWRLHPPVEQKQYGCMAVAAVEDFDSKLNSVDYICSYRILLNYNIYIYCLNLKYKIHFACYINNNFLFKKKRGYFTEMNMIKILVNGIFFYRIAPLFYQNYCINYMNYKVF